MNILFFFTLPIIPHFGGVQRVTDVLTKEFLRRGHNVIFLCCDGYKSIGEYKDVLSAPQEYIDLNSSNADTEIKAILYRHNIDFVINQAAYAKESIKFLKSVGPNIRKVSCYHNDPFYFVGKERDMISTMRPKNVLGYLQKNIALLCPYIYTYMKLNATKNIFRSVLNLSDRFCLLSDRFSGKFINIMNLTNLQSANICAINNPNTFDVADTDCIKQNIILYVGRLELHQKRSMDFVKMWELLYKNNPNWQAVVVGDGSQLSRMRDYVSSQKIENITFKGKQSNVREYFEQAKVVCLTSNYEGWGMVLGEGMACGCVPLSYDTYAAVHDIIDNDVNGYVTKPFSPSDMAEKIQYLIDNPDRLEMLSNAAKRKVVNFTVENIVDQWESLYRSLMYIKE